MKNIKLIFILCFIALWGCASDDENEAILIMANEELSGDWTAISYESNDLELIPFEIDSCFIRFEMDAMAKTGRLSITQYYQSEFSTYVTAGQGRIYTIISDNRLLTSRIDTVQYLVGNDQLIYEYTSDEGEDIRIVLVK
jgi:hypothetical protein